MNDFLFIIILYLLAVSPADYYTIDSSILTFKPCDDEQCITIRIMDDETLEQRERFTVSLDRPPGLTENIELVDTRKEVVIIDNDSKCPCMPCNICHSLSLVSLPPTSDYGWLQ